MSKHGKKFPALVRVRVVFLPRHGHAFIISIFPLPSSPYVRFSLTGDGGGGGGEKKNQQKQQARPLSTQPPPATVPPPQDMMRNLSSTSSQDGMDEDLHTLLRSDPGALELLQDALMKDDGGGALPFAPSRTFTMEAPPARTTEPDSGSTNPYTGSFWLLPPS